MNDSAEIPQVLSLNFCTVTMGIAIISVFINEVLAQLLGFCRRIGVFTLL